MEEEIDKMIYVGVGPVDKNNRKGERSSGGDERGPTSTKSPLALTETERQSERDIGI
jgi:hypothetical protein